MRHGKKFNHLSRTAPHRSAMLSNMASSLILHKRIVTTVAKAKALRKYVEPLITRAKEDTTHSRRMVFRYLQNKQSVQELFNDVSERVMDRPGGYTRILKTGHRLGDNASMCVIELVDYNESMLKEAKPKKSKTRRGRRSKSGSKAAAAAVATEAVDTPVEAATAEEAIETEQASEEEAAVETADSTEEASAEAQETAETAEEPAAEAEPEAPAAAEEATDSEPDADETADAEASAAEEE